MKKFRDMPMNSQISTLDAAGEAIAPVLDFTGKKPIAVETIADDSIIDRLPAKVLSIDFTRNDRWENRINHGSFVVNAGANDETIGDANLSNDFLNGAAYCNSFGADAAKDD